MARKKKLKQNKPVMGFQVCENPKASRILYFFVILF